MTLRAADLRFALPTAPRTAVVLGDSGPPALDAILSGFRAAGITASSRQHGRDPADVVIAAAADAGPASRIPARAYLILGRQMLAHPRRRASGAQQAALVVRGGFDRPTTVLPTRPRMPLIHYLDSVVTPLSTRTRMRNRVLSAGVRLRMPARLAGNAFIAVPGEDRPAGPPFMMAAAADLGVPVGPAWRLSLGAGDDLQRALFYVFDGPRPAWVLKFSRKPGCDKPFARDEQALAEIGRLGLAVSSHAPAHLGRLSVDGLPGSVETVAPGRPLVAQLPGTGARLVDAIADWVLCLGERSARPPAALAAERARLAAEVVPHWTASGAPPDLVNHVPPVPAVFQHNDLGSWNIMADSDGFVAVDWESARSVGLPLWDLLYFLGDALPRLDGTADADTLLDRTVAIFAGRTPRSGVLFEWVARAAARMDIPTRAVGPVATLCWLHHGLSADARRIALREAPGAPLGHLTRLAGRWLSDPDLGVHWSAWRPR